MYFLLFIETLPRCHRTRKLKDKLRATMLHKIEIEIASFIFLCIKDIFWFKYIVMYRYNMMFVISFYKIRGCFIITMVLCVSYFFHHLIRVWPLLANWIQNQIVIYHVSLVYTYLHFIHFVFLWVLFINKLGTTGKTDIQLLWTQF